MSKRWVIEGTINFSTVIKRDTEKEAVTAGNKFADTIAWQLAPFMKKVYVSNLSIRPKEEEESGEVMPGTDGYRWEGGGNY